MVTSRKLRYGLIDLSPNNIIIAVKIAPAYWLFIIERPQVMSSNFRRSFSAWIQQSRAAIMTADTHLQIYNDCLQQTRANQNFASSRFPKTSTIH